MPTLDQQSAISFANQLRAARVSALADAEAFDGIVQAVERLGSYLYGKLAALNEYKPKLCGLAAKSGLAVPGEEMRGLLTPFSDLYELTRIARNDAVHQGASARHLTRHAIELVIILEDALSSEWKFTVADFMVRNPTCAELWHPIGFVRQQMLANSFSYLPVLGNTGVWSLVSDASIARFLGTNKNKNIRNPLLSKSLRDARLGSSDLLETVVVIPADADISVALDHLKHKNALVVGRPASEHSQPQESILGILTAFDLL